MALYIEFCAHHRAQLRYIAAAYVALVGTRMHRDAVGAETLAILRRLHHGGAVFATRVAQRGYFVNVYAKVGFQSDIFYELRQKMLKFAFRHYASDMQN